MDREKLQRAIILLSGGLDSATLLALAHSRGHDCHALSFDYGQRHKGELQAANRVARSIGVVEHVVIDIDLGQFGNSALTADIDVPKHETVEDIGEGIPVTYVPARNTIFLSLGLAFAESRGARQIFIGVNALDYSGYPDCRPEFIEAFQAVANLGTKAATESGQQISIEAPLVDMTKADIIAMGSGLGVDYSLTTSCYDPIGEYACARCDACLLRQKGFQENGLEDPIRYKKTGDIPASTD
jgi:7-cyano-7-deazaguanine synthase